MSCFDLTPERSIEERRQALATFAERKRAQIVVAVAQEIESDERRWLVLVDALEVRSTRQVDTALQPLETGRAPAIVERDDLAVENDGSIEPARDLFEGCDDRGKLRGLVVPVARPHADARAAGRAGVTSMSARMPSYFGS